MQQLRDGLHVPSLPFEAYITAIPQERATKLATGAMHFAHKLLAVVSKENEEVIESTFVAWYDKAGQQLLSMDPKSARDFEADEGSDDEEYFCEELASFPPG